MSTYNNNGQNQLNVNTTGMRFKGAENALMLDLWNKRVSLGIARKFAQSEKTEDGYNYDWMNPVKVTFDQDTGGRLLKSCERVMNGEVKVSGVDLQAKGVNYLLCLRDAGNDKYQLVLEKELYEDAGARKSNGQIIYTFQSAVLIEDYDGENGTFKTHAVNNELDLFVQFLKDFKSGANMVIPHMIKEANKKDRAQHLDALSKLGAALNVTLDFGKKNNYPKNDMSWDNGMGGDDIPF